MNVKAVSRHHGADLLAATDMGVDDVPDIPVQLIGAVVVLTSAALVQLRPEPRRAAPATTRDGAPAPLAEMTPVA